MTVLKDKKFTEYNSEVYKISYLRDSIKSMEYYVADEYKSFGSSERKLFFTGYQDRMRFITSNPLSNFDSLFVSDLKFDNSSVILREAPVFDPQNDYLNPDTVRGLSTDYTIFDDVSNASFRYLIDGSYVSEADGSIPQLVEITVDTEDRGRLIYYFAVESDDKLKRETVDGIYVPQ
jgi:hypothetical protein